MGKKIFKNARLLDPESKLDAMGSVLIDNGVILDVGPSVFVDAMQDDIEVIDCLGVCLCPGLIDMRVATGDSASEHMFKFEIVSNYVE